MIIKNIIIVINFLLTLWLGGPHLVCLILKARIQIQLPSNLIFSILTAFLFLNDIRNNNFSKF
jgi:hypothetical protein